MGQSDDEREGPSTFDEVESTMSEPAREEPSGAEGEPGSPESSEENSQMYDAVDGSSSRASETAGAPKPKSKLLSNSRMTRSMANQAVSNLGIRKYGLTSK